MASEGREEGGGVGEEEGGGAGEEAEGGSGGAGDEEGGGAGEEGWEEEGGAGKEVGNNDSMQNFLLGWERCCMYIYIYRIMASPRNLLEISYG